ncbi:MAG TPA: hypothetical protein VGS20_15470 [Candidatus Acidoferrales bacterium]|nr:hypothetical protein [Candidatus Acidoferrales bacterium]
MPDLTALDVAIGLTFVYLTLSLLCTGINEWWSRKRRLRSQFLREGIHRLLAAWPQGNAVTQAFYSNPLIRGLSREDDHPSYLSSRVFALALVDAAKRIASPDAPPATIRQAIDQMPTGDLKQELQSLASTAKSDDEEALQKIEAWFDDGMDRVSGWYKRRMQVVTLVVASAVTIVANADTLAIIHRLWVNPAMRAAVVAHAEARAKQPPPLQLGYTGQSAVPTQPVATPSSAEPIVSPDERDALAQLLSWSDDFRVFHRMVAQRRAEAGFHAGGAGDPGQQVRACLQAQDTVRSMLCTGYSPTPIPDCEAARKILADQRCAVAARKVDEAATDGSFPGLRFFGAPMALGEWLWWLVPSRIIGWLLTIFAISLGAPFWFGALQKLVNIRSSGVSPSEKQGGAQPGGSASGGSAG